MRKINVHMFPDEKSGLFFWCILEHGNNWYNIGSGWATCPRFAFEEARKYLKEIEKDEQQHVPTQSR